MHRIFLLRAYGDFVILLQAINRSPNKKSYQLIASKHLEDLYKALSNKIDFNGVQIQFVDFEITKNQLGLFTNKHFLRSGTLLEVKNIKVYIQSNPNTTGIDYIEQDKRIGLLNLLTSHTFKAILFDEPIYERFDAFFQNEKTLASPVLEKVSKVVLFPDSRLPKKNIPAEVITIIEQALQTRGIQVQAAYFKKTNKQNDLSYDSFDSLIGIIESAHFIIGADSLPIHICNLLQKPHYIMYPKGYSQLFMTPFVKSNELFGTFDHFDLSFIQ